MQVMRHANKVGRIATETAGRGDCRGTGVENRLAERQTDQ
jgi:hypothetical protein